MKRLNKMTYEEIIDYNLRDGGTAVTIFADTQGQRVGLARKLIENILAEDPGRKLIYEPGCSAGDISGFFSKEHEVIGFDVSPAAVAATRSRYPEMQVSEARIEEATPVPCDILVLCEFMEHVIDPIGLAKAWIPLAKHVVIGHPLVGDGTDPERGHVWAYDVQDFMDWFELGGHTMVEAWEFPMGYRMAIGRGRRKPLG
jgi:hypothetical protein